MRCMFHATNRIAVCGILIVSITSTGCRSGWKMPTPSMLSFKKKPSAETLAGKGPTMTAPTSPATSQTPSLMAGTNGKSATKPSPYGTASQTNGPSVTPPSTTSLASATSPYAKPSTPMPGQGAAATANGYATGPYNTYNQSQAPNAAYASASSGNSMGYSAPSNGGASGTSYTGVPAGAPSSSMPNMNSAAYPGLASAAPMPYGESAVPPMQSTQSYANAPSGGSYGLPPAGSTAAKPAAPPMAYPNLPIAGGPIANNAPSVSSYNPVGGIQMPSNMSAMPSSTPVINASTASYASPAPTAPAATASYRPGSIQRTTGYDFSSPSSTALGSGLPANTASGAANPGYQLPPSQSYNR